MTEFVAKKSQGYVYLKQELQDILRGPDLKAIANGIAVVLFDDSADLNHVMSSLELTIQEIRLMKRASAKLKPLDEYQHSS